MTRVGLRSPRFLAFLSAQFLGAFNDSAFKMTMLFTLFSLAPAATEQVALSSLGALLFPVPFLLFSQLAGWLADRFAKHRVLLLAKMPEVAVMLLGAVALSQASFGLLLLAYFLMATQSAFFSPAKYGILPEVLEDRDLSLGNGLLDMATNLAILLGTVGGTLIYSAFRDTPGTAGWIFAALACVGVGAIAYAPRGSPGRADARLDSNPIRVAQEDLARIRTVPVLGYTVLGLAWFAALGSLLLAIVPIYGLNELGLGEAGAGGLLTLLALGIAAGAILAGRLSQGRVELGLVPIGAAGIFAFCADLAVFAGGSESALAGVPLRAAFDLTGLGVSAGLFSVPLNALLQQRAPAGHKGRIIGFSNMVSFAGVLLAAGLSYGVTQLAPVAAGSLLLALALLTAVGTIVVLRLLPDFLVRLVVYLLINTLYRLRVTGHENIPREQGALFVANHVSWIDALVVAAASGRMVRFLMFRPYYEMPAFRWLFESMHVIPVAGGDPPEKTQASLDQARDEIAAGHVVCIFAEGTITRTGQLLGFRRGLERIARNAEAPIVPVCLVGLWGSLFSFEGGTALFKRPRRFRHGLQVLFGAPLPHDASAFEVRQAVESLSADAPRTREASARPLASELWRTARLRWWRPFAVDSTGRSLRYGDAWIAARALRRRIFDGGRAADPPMGVLLPAGIPAVVASLAVLSAGGTVALLPPSREAIRRVVEDARVRRIVADRGLLARLGGPLVAPEVEWIFVGDEIARRLSPAARLAVWAAVRLLPPAVSEARWVERDTRATRGAASTGDRPVAILFSRGTVGPPRPSAYSDLAVRSNLGALRQVFDVGPDDGILGIVLMSHPFGFIGTFGLAAFSGARVAFHSDPSELDTVARMAREQRCTLLFATPAMLARQLAHVSPESFASLRRVVSGGSPLPDRTRAAFEERFCVPVLEGYGVSGCAPILSLNVPDVRVGRKVQAGGRAGTIGTPPPGIAVRIADPATGAPRPPGEAGALFVRGASLCEEDLSRVATEPWGWRDTGDVGLIDDDGLLIVIDRADRIVRVPGGEVALGRLEQLLQEAIAAEFPAGTDLSERIVAVPRRGGDGGVRVGVVCSEGAPDAREIRRRLEERRVPDHWIPAEADFVSVAALPLRDTGLVDLAAAARL